MSAVSERDERDLVAGVKRAADLVETGLAPDTAVEKVAREYGFGPGKIRLIAHGYNTGRQLDQWNQSGGVLDKLASFPLADPEAVIARVYGPEKQAEVEVPISPEYRRPPDWVNRRSTPAPTVKAAAALPAPPPSIRRAFGDIDRAKRAAADTRRQAAQLTDQLSAKVSTLTRYFRKSAYDRLPFEAVEAAAAAEFGKAGTALLDHAYGQARLTEKRAGAVPPQLTRGLDKTAGPFPTIRECVTLARELNQARTRAKEAADHAIKVEAEALRPFSAATPPRPDVASTKEAGLLGTPAVGAFVGSMLSRSIGAAPKSTGELVDDAWLDLEDPQHANELRKIKTHAMINSMMTDPDSPISGHDPEKVLQAYNEIAQLAPRAAEQPAVLGPLLRRRLEGHAEPFEAKEMTDIEKGLAASKAPTPNTSLLSEAPDKLLG